MTDLRQALLEMAERGSARGADAVVYAAVVEAERHELREGSTMPPGPHTWRRRLGRAVAAVAAASVLVTGATFVYVRHKLDEVTNVDLGGTLSTAAADDEPINVLVVGSDGRPDVDGARADTIIVVRLDPTAHRVAMLSVPRDLWVPIAGTDRHQRINTALHDGADALVRTVSALLDIPINHYVEIGFDGFQEIVDVVGGVAVAFDAPTRDVVTGLNVSAAGCVRLDGSQALALVRSRHNQRLVEGQWESEPTGDLGRIRRQQQFLLQLASEVASSRNPLTLNRLLDAVVKNVRLDSELDASQLLRLARQLGSFEPSAVVSATLPGTLANVGQAAVLLPDYSGTKAAVSALLNTTVVNSPRTGSLPPSPALTPCT